MTLTLSITTLAVPGNAVISYSMLKVIVYLEKLVASLLLGGGLPAGSGCDGGDPRMRDIMTDTSQ